MDKVLSILMEISLRLGEVDGSIGLWPVGIYHESIIVTYPKRCSTPLKKGTGSLIRWVDLINSETRKLKKKVGH